MILSQIDIDRPAFLIWDSDGQPPKGDWIPVLWREFGEGDDPLVYSVPRRLEERADTLRARFLEWIYNLGEAQVDGKRLVDHLALRSGFSFWWMTLLTEKSNAFKSLQIIDVLKLFTLEDLIGVRSDGKLILVSGNKRLALTFRLWCSNANRAFEWRQLKERVDAVALARRIYRTLPHPLQALVALLLHIGQQWPLRNTGKKQFAKTAAKITFCSYLFNLDKKSAQLGRLYTSYWTELHNVIEHNSKRVNWLLLFIKHEAVPTAQQGQNLINRFNQSGASTQSHAPLDGALGWAVIWGTIRDYARIVLAGLRLRKARCHFRPAHSKVDFWPMFERDWRSSLFGATAMSNCLFLNLFESTVKGLPRQELGVYLQENIGWEMAFVHAWKSAGHGRLVGVPHTTVRYWDLRYFFDPRSYSRTGKNDLPLPDLVALNGPAAIDAYLKGGFPENRIIEVEALRYLQLSDLPPARCPSKGLSTAPLRVLVLGDYMQTVTAHQLQWLVSAAAKLPPDTCYLVKPHPACPIKKTDYPSLQMQITGLSLEKLLADCDVAYTSNMTSAAVDAYSAGIPVVSVLDGDAFNISPLRGLAGVTYVTSPTELAHALSGAQESGEIRIEPYFCLDKRLPRWRRVLGLQELAAT